MGIGCKELYATRIDKDDKNLFVSHWIPEKKKNENCEDRWYMPPNTALGFDIYEVPDFFPELKFEDDPIEVEVVKSDEETGMWLIVADEYFGGEEHLFTGSKPSFKDCNNYFYSGRKEYKIDWEKSRNEDWTNHIHIRTNIGAKSGDLFPVKLVKKVPQ